jgi:hypothetical protein
MAIVLFLFVHIYFRVHLKPDWSSSSRYSWLFALASDVLDMRPFPPHFLPKEKLTVRCY